MIRSTSHLWPYHSGSFSVTFEQIPVLINPVFWALQREKKNKEVLKPEAAVKEAVIRLRSGSGSAY